MLSLPRYRKVSECGTVIYSQNRVKREPERKFTVLHGDEWTDEYPDWVDRWPFLPLLCSFAFPFADSLCGRGFICVFGGRWRGMKGDEGEDWGWNSDRVSINPCIHPSSNHPTIHPSNHPSILLSSMHPFIHLFNYASIHASVHSSAHPSIQNPSVLGPFIHTSIPSDTNHP